MALDDISKALSAFLGWPLDVFSLILDKLIKPYSIVLNGIEKLEIKIS